MSNFHRVKDRYPNGKPKPHRKKAGPGSEHFSTAKNPGWWNNLTSTRRRRANDRQNIHHVMRGVDDSAIAWRNGKLPLDYFY